MISLESVEHCGGEPEQAKYLWISLESVEHCGGEPEQAATMATHE